MSTERIKLPPEQSAALEAAWRSSSDAWRAGDAVRALAIAAEAWAQLPEPATQVDFAEALALTTTKYATAHDRLTEAQVWLQLAREAYGGDQAADITRAGLDFRQGCIEYRSGNLDTAYRIFDAVSAHYGQRFFNSDDPVYWDFYRQRKTKLLNTPEESLLPSPNLGPAKAPEPDPETAARIQQLVNLANDLDDYERYIESEPLLLQALNLIPDPKAQSGLSLQIYGALGDDYWSQGRLAQAENALWAALQCSGGLTNPFIWLRLGQALYDQHGITDQSVDALLRAYMLDHGEVFGSEDPKYLSVLKQRGLID